MAQSAAGSQFVPKLTGGVNSILIVAGATTLAKTEKTSAQMSAEVKYLETLTMKIPHLVLIPKPIRLPLQENVSC